MQGEGRVAAAILDANVAALPTLPGADAGANGALTGRLRLTAALVRALDRRCLGASAHGGLVPLLIRGESWSKVQESGSRLTAALVRALERALFCRVCAHRPGPLHTSGVDSGNGSIAMLPVPQLLFPAVILSKGAVRTVAP